MRKQVTRRRRKPSPWSGTIRIAIVFVLLVAVNVYFFFLRRGTSIADLARLSAAKKLPPAAIAPSVKRDAREAAAKSKAGATPEPLGEDEGRVVVGTVGERETLSAALKRAALPTRTVGQLVDALGKVLDLKTAAAGHEFVLRFDTDDRLRSLDYRTLADTLFRVERRGETWRAARETAALATLTVEVGGILETTLYAAFKRSGETRALGAIFVDLFAWDIDFYLDSQAGDRFKVVVEKLLLDGRFYKYGRVLAAEYEGRIGTFRAFWYEPEPGRGAYYNERGESITKSLLKTPLKFVDVSPSFDRRRLRPILRTESAHLGVDYAAPTGTPVLATAAGKVSWKGPKGSAGNCVVIAHPGGMESIYMHLAKFPRGLEVGEEVRQKQVIGFVGDTATGSRLHFSIKMGGHFVDPLRLRPAREAPLGSSDRAAFFAAVELRSSALAKLDVKAPPRLEEHAP